MDEKNNKNQNQGQNNKDGNKGNKFNQTLLILLIAGVITVLAISCVNTFLNNSTSQEISYTDFISMLENWDGSDYGPYAKVFDDTHSDWKQDPEMNLFYLRARQAQANDMLKSQGHLFLNEVYDMLGFKRTKAGAVVGWIYDDKKPYGDNFVDFGMTEIRRHDADSDEYKRAFILDFNVVGDITSKIVDHQNDYLA